MELTKQALKVDNNQSFPNNNAGLITPTALRTFNENMIDSNVNQQAYTADSASFNNRINAATASFATGSFATTGSNTFTGNQDILGNISVGQTSQILSGYPNDMAGRLELVPNSANPNSIELIVQTRANNTSQYAGVNIVARNAGDYSIGVGGLGTTPVGVFRPGVLSFVDSAVSPNGAVMMTLSSTQAEILENTRISGSLTVTGSLTHSLQEGFVLVGNSSGITTAVSTGSFGGGGTGNGFPFSGSAVITGSLSVSETVKSQVYMNPQTLDGFTIPTGNNAMLVGPVAISGSVVVEGTSNLIVLSQVTGSGGSGSVVLPSGLLSSSVTDFTTYSASVDSRINGLTGSYATTGSNTFVGDQIITGSLFVSSSNEIRIVAPNFPGSPAPGGVSVTGSFAVNGNFAVQGGNFFASQLNTAKLVGNSGVVSGLALVSDVLIYNDDNINIPRRLGVSGSAYVSQSLYTADLYVGGNKQFNGGEFFSTTTQSGSAGVSGSITFNNSGSVSGVSLVNNSQLTIANAGTYNIQFSAQIEATGGADTAYIWFKKNGTNIPDSATKVVLENNTAQVMTVNILDIASANDYYELAYQFTGGNATILAEVASGNIPAIPSVIATVTQVR